MHLQTDSFNFALANSTLMEQMTRFEHHEASTETLTGGSRRKLSDFGKPLFRIGAIGLWSNIGTHILSSTTSTIGSEAITLTQATLQLHLELVDYKVYVSLTTSDVDQRIRILTPKLNHLLAESRRSGVLWVVVWVVVEAALIRVASGSSIVPKSNIGRTSPLQIGLEGRREAISIHRSRKPPVTRWLIDKATYNPGFDYGLDERKLSDVGDFCVTVICEPWWIDLESLWLINNILYESSYDAKLNHVCLAQMLIGGGPMVVTIDIRDPSGSIFKETSTTAKRFVYVAVLRQTVYFWERNFAAEHGDEDGDGGDEGGGSVDWWNSKAEKEQLLT
ncbi:hypothetical protein GALMADRAFT_213387 [Galerina marginata CBS 339.88]|uniref:Uncharacterized protein n=1 Tax=Galerina marginata (strain CBS 339.88) TaxID=685588 RepID=A0A067SNA5_GALM3|nr:hypothetical protein GALMADRAFT_213387 [Galerina marginata CBS 339.88]